MPFHEGDTFDVDCIAKEGKLVLAIPRLRLYENPVSPTNQGCIITSNKIIYNYCKKIVKAFNIYGACDFDIVIRKDLKPQLLDSSCRLSGSVGASLQANINVTAELIKMLHGKKLSTFKLKKSVKVFPTPLFVKSL